MSQDRNLSFDGSYRNDQRQQYHDYPQRLPLPQHTLPPQDSADRTSIDRPRSTYNRRPSRPAYPLETPSRVEPSADGETWSSLPPPPPPHQSPRRILETHSPSTAPNMDSSRRQLQSSGPQRIAREIADEDYREGGMDNTREPAPAPATTPAHNIYRLQDRSSPYPSQPSLTGFHRDSYGSNFPLYAGAATPGSMTPHAFASDARSSQHSMLSLTHDGQQQYALGPMDSYHDSPYHNSQQHVAAVNGANINPYDIADDGDDGFMPEPKRRSMMPIGRQKSHEKLGAAAAAAGTTGGLGGMMSRKQKNAASSGSYDPVRQPGVEEKSERLSRQTERTSKMRWMVGAAIGFAVVLAIIAGIVGAVLGTRNNSGGGGNNSNTASGDTATNGDLNINSAEIQKLMNNKNLHKVFPGIDYTPWGTQYPLCTTYPPSQNNVTRDMAVLSQLTNAVRLYGTDCNQTEMVLHAIDRLQLKNMKVWLGVWIDTNATTTRRQLEQMYKILAETQDHSIFKGTIIGNEALYRAGEAKAQSEAELISMLNAVRSNFTTLGYNLPIATSDLGDNWNGQLVTASDYVMSNIHPFFAGVDIANAASWTWNFWQTHDVVLTVNTPVKQLISETGWPSGGGTDCGNAANTCAPGQTGSVASVANMNRFMNDWVCSALRNGTEYFWFEAFDEPWKVQYNSAGQEWEDKWGLMTPDRNLKPGLIIPSCGGKTVS